jgi:acyl carrier protein
MDVSIISKILEILNANLDGAELTSENIDVDLSQHDMDSITFITIVVNIEERFDIEYPDESLLITESNTIK